MKRGLVRTRLTMSDTTPAYRLGILIWNRLDEYKTEFDDEDVSILVDLMPGFTVRLRLVAGIDINSISVIGDYGMIASVQLKGKTYVLSRLKAIFTACVADKKRINATLTATKMKAQAAATADEYILPIREPAPETVPRDLWDAPAPEA
jgi:hypothetical protein